MQERLQRRKEPCCKSRPPGAGFQARRMRSSCSATVRQTLRRMRPHTSNTTATNGGVINLPTPHPQVQRLTLLQRDLLEDKSMSTGGKRCQPSSLGLDDQSYRYLLSVLRRVHNRFGLHDRQWSHYPLPGNDEKSLSAGKFLLRQYGDGRRCGLYVLAAGRHGTGQNLRGRLLRILRSPD